jgi:hypothetical protein
LIQANKTWRQVIIDGYQARAGEPYPAAWVNTVDEHFFPLMEMPVLRDRVFDARDTASSPQGGGGE